jgi:hypothetical protein
VSLLAVLVVVAVLYALNAYPLYLVAKRTSDVQQDAWYAWVPIANVVLMCRLAGMSCWWIATLFIPYLGALVFTLTAWVKIGKRFGHTGLGVLAALLPILGAWVFAFSIEPEGAR